MRKVVLRYISFRRPVPCTDPREVRFEKRISDAHHCYTIFTFGLHVIPKSQIPEQFRGFGGEALGMRYWPISDIWCPNNVSPGCSLKIKENGNPNMNNAKGTLDMVHLVVSIQNWQLCHTFPFYRPWPGLEWTLGFQTVRMAAKPINHMTTQCTPENPENPVALYFCKKYPSYSHWLHFSLWDPPWQHGWRISWYTWPTSCGYE